MRFRLTRPLVRARNEIGRTREYFRAAKAVVRELRRQQFVNKARIVAQTASDRLDGVYTFDAAARSIDGTKAP
jgi:hypothetical protein